MLTALFNFGKAIVRKGMQWFNQERPHQGMDQRIPAPSDPISPALDTSQPICVFPVLGGLHHVYRRAA